MLAPNLAAAHNGLSILMEMAADRRPISRSALKQRCVLGVTQLDDALRFLTRAGLILREDGEHGRFCLARPPEEIHLNGLVAGMQWNAAPAVFSVLNGETTLADLSAATQTVEDALCPYYDACVTLGGPGGPGTEGHCRPECAD